MVPVFFGPRHLGRGALAIACVLGVSTARANVSPDDLAKATALFKQGQIDLESGGVNKACDEFAESLRLANQIGTRLNLAACRELQGKLVEAYTLFDEALAEAVRTKEGREGFARERVTALAAKLVRVTLRVAETNVAGMLVRLGGREIGRDEWSKEQAVEPGTIVVESTAPDRKPFRVERSGVAGTKLTIDVRALDSMTAIEPPTKPHHWTPWIVGASGGALVLGSLAIVVHTKSRYDPAFAAMDEAGVTSARHEADIATVVGVAGLAAVAVGVVLYLRTPSEPNRLVIAPIVGGDAVGLIGTSPF